MTDLSRFKFTIPIVVLFTFIIAVSVQAEEYKWLKTSDHEKIFVYTDLDNCDFIAGKINETIKRTFLRDNIKATISDSLVFQKNDTQKESTRELIDNKLTAKNKIILYVYGKCIEYKSGYIYQFNVNFAVINNKYSQALIYSSPHHNAMGLDTTIGIDRAFRKLMNDAVTEYVAANN